MNVLTSWVTVMCGRGGGGRRSETLGTPHCLNKECAPGSGTTMGVWVAARSHRHLGLHVGGSGSSYG